MKIVIKYAGQRFPITLLFPTGLVLNRLTAYFAPMVLRGSEVTITRKQAVRFIKELKRCKRRYRGWKLVEVKSADGEYVEIKL